MAVYEPGVMVETIYAQGFTSLMINFRQYYPGQDKLAREYFEANLRAITQQHERQGP